MRIMDVSKANIYSLSLVERQTSKSLMQPSNASKKNRIQSGSTVKTSVKTPHSKCPIPKFPSSPKQTPNSPSILQDFLASTPSAAFPFAFPSLAFSGFNGLEGSYPTLFTIPNPLVLPSRKSNRSPGARYSGLCTNLNATVALSPVRM